MVLLAGTTGLRRSELIALRWHDVDFEALQISVNKSCVRGQLGETKTLASARPVPIHAIVGDALRVWQESSPYSAPEDFLFPSLKNNGSIQVWPDMILQKIIRPALERAGLGGKRVGWHTFRHSLATNLRSLGIDVRWLKSCWVTPIPGSHWTSIPRQSRLKSDKHVTNWWRCCWDRREPTKISTLQHP
jgi:integrase